MRDLDSARKSWQDLKQYDSIRELKDAVRLDGPSSIATEGCRSACWKAFLIFDSLDTSVWQRLLSSSRSAYNSVRSHFLRHLENPEELEAGYDPLSEDTDASPWTQLRKDEELRAEILQDVARCMPENLYFRQPETQRILLDILFIFCKLNPDVSYRQGMHELLAPILWVVERDAIDLGQSSKTMGEDAIIKNVFDAEHIEHDSFTLFGQVMQSAKNFYEQTTVSGTENPIVARSRRIFNDLLPKVDRELAKHLESIDVVPQVFLMRWIRLLFGREFDFDEMLTVWDVIFAEDPTLDIVDEISLAMILRIRWQLVEADYNTALTLLLRYPEVEKDNPPQTLALDAMYLREHMDQHGGSYLVSKYSGRALQQTGRPITPPALQRNITAVSGPTIVKPTSKTSRLSPSNMPGAAKNIEAVFQSTAKSIYARSEKLGIGKAVRSAVDEVHKRAQEIRDAQTPSAPVMYRQRGSRSSLGPSAMQNRIKALEDRSRQLSKLLEGAVSELWDYQKQVAQKREDDASAETPADVEQLSVAIAKVQFVQVYLDDPKLPLPEETNRSDSNVEAESNSSSMVDVHDREKGSISEKQGVLPPSSDPSVLTSRSQLSPSPQMGVEDLADPSSFEDLEESSPIPEKEVPEVLFENEDTQSYLQAGSEDTSETRETLSTRPRLEQSSFSFMLGDEDPSTRPFSSATSFAPDQNRSKGFLFGEDTVGGDSKDTSRRGGSGKQRKASAGVVLPSEHEGFDLGSLRHGNKR